MRNQVRTKPNERFQAQASPVQAARPLRRRAVMIGPGPCRGRRTGPWPGRDPCRLRAVPGRRGSRPWAPKPAAGAPRGESGGRLDGAARIPRQPCSRSRRRAERPGKAVCSGTPRRTPVRPSPHDGWCHGSQPQSEAGWRREARSLRRTGARGPWNGARRGSSDRRASACEAEIRASWPDGDCWAGTCASWSGSWRTTCGEV